MAHQAGAYPGFCSIKRLGIFLLPLDGMLVHRRATQNIMFAGKHLYTWGKRGTVGVKCLAQEHKAMAMARAQTRNAQSGVELTNHEATAPPSLELGRFFLEEATFSSLSIRPSARGIQTASNIIVNY